MSGKAQNNLPAFRLLVVSSTIFLAFYVPLETWVSREQLLGPGFVCDLIAFILLGFGCWAAHSHPTHSLAPLAAAWGYCFALFWRAYFMRVAARQLNWPIYQNEHRLAEPLLIVAMAIACLLMLSCIYLALIPETIRPGHDETD